VAYSRCTYIIVLTARGYAFGKIGNSRWPKFSIDFTQVRRSLLSGSRAGLPRQQSQSGSLPSAPVKVGTIHGAPERRWQRRRFLLTSTNRQTGRRRFGLKPDQVTRR
jgi:hypothetical protein